MKQFVMDSIQTYLVWLEDKSKDKTFLFRGQAKDDLLLPKIARPDPNRDTTEKEKGMLKEFRRRVSFRLNSSNLSNWDLLVVGRHHSMDTRLLDWTTNPLVALWFACENMDSSYDSFVYIFFPKPSDIIDVNLHPDPFAIRNTKVLQPSLHDERAIAQNGWFTAHAYSSNQKKFVPLNKNRKLKKGIARLVIPKEKKIAFFNQLDTLGINNQSLFPDIDGICRHVNWIFK